ncbi:PQQ-dependent sugar dehydrogenase [Sphingomonas sp. GB1N7]|uniref:PQQ-dependent sugar dehydrogenase n=1 Tax=Parasphingomonas caseinilytica TaxID=3096158 RepID=UPI002FC97FDB
MKNVRTRAGTRLISTAIFGLALSGCGGSDTPAPAPVNNAPTITSSAAASVVENSTGVAYQASATDRDGDSVTLSLAGTDAARFTISGAGEVRFVSPPNFEKPTDADADNVYTLQLSASDGKATVSQAVTITVTNSKEGVSVERIASGFSHPVAIVTIPGQSQLMVAERSGAIYIYDPATQARTLFATIEGLTNAEQQGIFSIAVQPNFATRRIVYALSARNGRLAVRQIFNNGGPTSFLDFAIGLHTQFPNNIGGWMGFGADGLLYVATGDAGGTNDPSGSAQSSTSLFGKLLSFSPGSFDAFSGAAVPPPIVPTVLARGLHYPIGATFYTGGLLLPDRGQSQREEVSTLPLVAGTIDNLGWPFREGTSIVVAGEPAGLVPPVLEYPHGTGQFAGQQIIGGLVFQGGNASLAGTYVVLDSTGAIFTAPLANLQRGTTAATSVFERRDLDFTPASGTITQPVSVVQDATGAIYIACDNGDIFRATAS